MVAGGLVVVGAAVDDGDVGGAAVVAGAIVVAGAVDVVVVVGAVVGAVVGNGFGADRSIVVDVLSTDESLVSSVEPQAVSRRTAIEKATVDHLSLVVMLR